MKFFWTTALVAVLGFGFVWCVVGAHRVQRISETKSKREPTAEVKYIAPIESRLARYLRKDRIISHTTSGTADTPETITHYLDRIPQGFVVVDMDKAANVYDFGTTWTDELIYLSCDVTTVAIKLIVF